MRHEREPLLIAATGERTDVATSTRVDADVAPAAVAGEARTGRRARRALQASAAAAFCALVAYAGNRELGGGNVTAAFGALVAYAGNRGLGEENVTAREYGKSIFTLRWDSTNGFRVDGIQGYPEGSLPVDARGLLEKTIEKYYPSRLAPGSDPFEVLYEIDDAPHTQCSSQNYAKTHCHFEKWQPIFAFGSSPRNNATLPTMRSATLLSLIPCISPAETLGSSPTIDVTKDTEPRCEFLEYKKKMKDMSGCDGGASDLRAYKDCNAYGLFNINAMQNKSEYEWDSLIDKAVWRGSDFMFLMGGNQAWPNGKPDGKLFFTEILNAQDRRAKMESLVASDRISPRFRAVLMSKLRPDIIDAKFFQSTLAGPVPLRARARNDPLDTDTSEHIEQDTLGKYRYQLDLGGGGGTTWTGTIPKLAMPGVLLHHETSMKDSYFDALEPYKHYLPLKEDLSNFDELIQFVKDNPQKAKEISAAASEWVRKFRKLGNLLRHNYWTVARPLATVLGMDPIPFHVAHPKLRGLAERF